MFNLQKQSAKLISVNPRTELHGEEHVLAIDLKFETIMGNDVLTEFHPALKEALFRIGDAPQGEIELEPGRLTGLKFPQLGPVKWDHECAGYRLTVHDGLDGTGNICLLAIKVDQFRFDCRDGGSVAIAFRVIVKPQEADVGRLCKMIQDDIDVSLIPPAANDDPAQADLDDELEEEAA